MSVTSRDREQQIAARIADDFLDGKHGPVSRAWTDGAGTVHLVLHDASQFDVIVEEVKHPYRNVGE